jgi:transaldolase
MAENPLRALRDLGQSIWLDYIDRGLLEDGSLARLIAVDGVSGLTSNPAIFEKAITHGRHYRPAIERLIAVGSTRDQVYEGLVLEDITRAADLYRDLYEHNDGADGYVSIEVSPLLARDTAATLAEARDIWRKLQRPNVMIKVPGTREGLPAVRTLLAEGINVNVTLLFSVGRYLQVLETYLEALETRLEQGLPLARVASVASFFLSRIDVAVDAQLDPIASHDPQRAAAARALRGRTAVASAAYAYRRFREVTAQPRWSRLAQAGARVQRLLWASTGTKDPVYSDIKYVEALIAPQTVNTLPTNTLAAYRDHGEPRVRIEHAEAEAPAVLHGLADLGIDLHQVNDALETEGIEKFVAPYQSLLATLDGLLGGG